MCADINRALLIGAHVDRRVPVEAQLAFSIVLLRLDDARFQREAIDAGDESALRFGVHVAGVSWIRKHPESISSQKIFPAAIGNPAWILRVAYPDAVVLQTAKDMIRIGVVGAHVIELRDRQVVALPPGVATVVGIPDASIVAGNEMLGIFRIHPHIMKIPVGAIADRAETPAAVFAEDQAKVGLVDFVFVFRIDDQVGEVKRPPDHQIAAVPLFPRLAAIFGAKKSAPRGLDQGIHDIWFGGRDGYGYTAPGLCGQSLGVLFIQLGPRRSSIRGLKKAAAAGGGGAFTAGTERPAFAPKIPHARKKDFGILGIHRNHRAARRGIGAFQNLVPVLSAVRRFVKATVLAVAPEFSRHAYVNGVAVFRVNNDFGNALRIRQAHIRPAVAAVRGLVNAVPDRNAVARP